MSQPDPDFNPAWEYKRIQKATSGLADLDATLAQLGRDGWELTTGIMSFDGLAMPKYVHLWLKRRIR